ncbi:MAG: hypothetical protein JSS28_03555 [Proteobacteria bacterium]|nr:hypothetical protein [Pseudomonadota bacterium]
MRSTLPIIVSCAVLLCGCQDTLFETQPGTHVAACDARFVGPWRLLPADSEKADDAFFVVVEPQCKRWRFIEDGKDDTKTENSVHVAFARVGDLTLLTLKEDQPAAHDPQARWSHGYRYLRYEFADATIRLHPVDDKRVAHLIIDGGIHGRTERISREPGSQRGSDDLHNFVAGDAQEMARVAQLDGIFRSGGYYILKPATAAEISGPMQPKADAKP